MEEAIKKAKEAIDLIKLCRFLTKTDGIAGGRGDYTFICPFHDEKTPSLQVYQNRFRCFGCDKSGDVISFVSEFYMGRISRRVFVKEALEILRGIYRIADIKRGSNVVTNRTFIKYNQKDFEKAFESTEIKNLSSYVARLSNIYNKTAHTEIEKMSPLRMFFSRRNMPVEWIGKYGLGYCKKFSRETAVEPNTYASLGLCLISKGNDKMFGRVIIPLFCPKGNPVALYGRDDGSITWHKNRSKYLASKLPEGYQHLFSGIIYGRKEAEELMFSLKRRILVITEGAFDCMRVLDAGIPSIGMLTANPTEARIEQIKQMNLEKVIICLDNDDAGRTGAQKIAMALSSFVPIVDSHMVGKEGDDIDSFMASPKNLEYFKRFILSR